MRGKNVASGACALLMMLGGGAAFAQTEEEVAEARQLYQEATAAFKDGQHREAALGFEKASRLKPHAVALYTAAQAWEAASELGRAADAYSQALSTPKLSDSQAERARERLAELSKSLGTVVITGDGARAQMDDHNEARAPAQLYGEPGKHIVLIIRDDGTVRQHKVTLEAGESVELDPSDEGDEGEGTPESVKLAEPKKKGVRVEPGPPSRATSVWTTVGFVTTGAGVAALGGAALFGVTAKGAEETYKGSPTLDTFDHAESVATRTNIMLVVGGVLTAGGVGLLVWQSTRSDSGDGAARTRVGVGPGSVFASGRF